jgi:hypothetical protein
MKTYRISRPFKTDLYLRAFNEIAAKDWCSKQGIVWTNVTITTEISRWNRVYETGENYKEA